MRIDATDGIDAARRRDVCERFGIVALSVFGSVARGDATPDSDIALLYDLGSDARLGWEIEDLVDELAEIFGRPVDLVARTALHPMLRTDVLAEAEAVYTA